MGVFVGINMRQVLLILSLALVKIYCHPQSTYTDPFTIAVDQIVRNTRLHIDTSARVQAIIDDCNRKETCGTGAVCLLDSSQKGILCKCKEGFSGETQHGNEAKCVVNL